MVSLGLVFGEATMKPLDQELGCESCPVEECRILELVRDRILDSFDAGKICEEEKEIEATET